MLGELGLGSLQQPEERVDLLGELVDELERRVVERALLECEGMDVPAHALAEDTLDEVLDRARDARLADDERVGPDRPVPLRDAAQARPDDAAVVRLCEVESPRVPDLLLQPVEECSDINRLGLSVRRNRCIFSTFRIDHGHRNIVTRGCNGAVSWDV